VVSKVAVMGKGGILLDLELNGDHDLPCLKVRKKREEKRGEDLLGIFTGFVTGRGGERGKGDNLALIGQSAELNVSRGRKGKGGKEGPHMSTAPQ